MACIDSYTAQKGTRSNCLFMPPYHNAVLMKETLDIMKSDAALTSISGLSGTILCGCAAVAPRILMYLNMDE